MDDAAKLFTEERGFFHTFEKKERERVSEGHGWGRKPIESKMIENIKATPKQGKDK
jgi:hypothetical protein